MPLVIALAFIVVPLVELMIILQVGELVGAAWTIVALLAISIAGAWLVRREGTKTWNRLTGVLRAGRMPADEVLQGALVLVGGALLLTPGFFTDAVGLLLVIPPSRALVASVIKTRVGQRVALHTFGAGGPFGQGANDASHRRSGRPATGADRGDVVDVEVVDVTRERRRPVDATTDADQARDRPAGGAGARDSSDGGAARPAAGDADDGDVPRRDGGSR